MRPTKRLNSPSKVNLETILDECAKSLNLTRKEYDELLRREREAKGASPLFNELRSQIRFRASHKVSLKEDDQ